MKETKDGLKAMPYYDKRKIYTIPPESNLQKSNSSSSYLNKEIEYAGMGSKKGLLPVIII